jgi:hypothetical protein
MRKYTQVHFICHGKCVCVWCLYLKMLDQILDGFL